MTTTLQSRPVRRETAVTVREGRAYRPLLVELGPHYVRVKPKGLRTWYELPYAAIWDGAVRAHVLEAKRLKLAKKKGLANA